MAKAKTAPRVEPETVALRAELVRRVLERIHDDGTLDTAIPGLALYRRSQPTPCMCVNYRPELVVFLQGEKKIDVGGTTHFCNGSNYLLTSVDLPVVSQVTKASRAEPITGMILALDMPMVREILSQDEFLTPAPPSVARGMAVGLTTAELLGACRRLLDLLDTPRDIPFMGSLLHREILYRVLRGPLGRHLRSIATLGDQGNRTARAVAWLRANFTRPLRVEELAGVAQMGVSTLHHHFRSLTSMSPLQYQKRLRLHAARMRMMTGGLDAASAAFEVGYESASQFNREYSRLFGQPPMRDVKDLRLAGASATSD